MLVSDDIAASRPDTRGRSFVRDGILTYIEQIAFGPFYWVVVGQAYLLTALSFGLLLASSYHATPLMRGQTLALAIGIAAPVIANVLLLTQILPRKFDPMPYGLVFMACTLWWAQLRHKLLDLIPLARTVMVDAMLDCVLAIDAQGRIIDVNRAMAELLQLPVALTLGRPLSEMGFKWGGALPNRQPLLALLSATHAPNNSQTLSFGERHFTPRIVALPARSSAFAGRLLVLHDVTERLRIEADRGVYSREFRGGLESRRLSELPEPFVLGLSGPEPSGGLKTGVESLWRRC